MASNIPTDIANTSNDNIANTSNDNIANTSNDNIANTVNNFLRALTSSLNLTLQSTKLDYDTLSQLNELAISRISSLADLVSNSNTVANTDDNTNKDQGNTISLSDQVDTIKSHISSYLAPQVLVEIDKMYHSLLQLNDVVNQLDQYSLKLEKYIYK